MCSVFCLGSGPAWVWDADLLPLTARGMGHAGGSLPKGHLERVSERPSNGNTFQAAPREPLFKQVTLRERLQIPLPKAGL